MVGPTTPSLPIPDFSPTGSQPPAQPFDFPATSNPQPAPGVPTPTPSSPSTPSGGQPSSSSGGGPTPSIVDNYKVKALLLNTALTSHYVCRFQPPGTPAGGPDGKVQKFLVDGGFIYKDKDEFISFSCSEASLPGSSLMTNEINDDHTGVTERHAYRRQYDDRIDFTFYVDRNYDIITFFERWISYCASENDAEALNNRYYSYRVNFPDDYQTDALYVTKFERDVFGTALEYKFIRAYPISITSMPVSYDSSQLLKCTVSFTYIRYVRKVVEVNKPTEPGQTTPPGIPPITTTEGDQINRPLGPTTTDGRPVPPFPGNTTIALAPQSTAPGVPSTILGQPTGSGTATVIGNSQRTTAGSQELPRVTNQSTPVQPTINKNAGSGAVINPTEEGTLEFIPF